VTPYDPLIGRFTQTLSIVDCGVHSTAREITLRSTLFWDRPLTIGNESGWHRRLVGIGAFIAKNICSIPAFARLWAQEQSCQKPLVPSRRRLCSCEQKQSARIFDRVCKCSIISSGKTHIFYLTSVGRSSPRLAQRIADMCRYIQMGPQIVPNASITLLEHGQ